MLIIFTISFLIIYYIINNYWNKERFEQQSFTKLSNVNCCLVEKKYVPNPNALFGGNFTYLFTKKSNEQCDNKLYNLNSNQQLLIDSDNNWTNDFCSKNPKNLDFLIGSCRNINKECIDFVNKEFCDKYKMKWSNKTCHDPSDYTWIDPIKNISPDKLNNGTFKMF